jgi:hypothetical protein
MKIQICKQEHLITDSVDVEHYGRMIKKVEDKFNAKFVFVHALYRSDYWTTEPYHIFYQENPPNGYSHYLAVSFGGANPYVTSGASMEGLLIQGVLANNGEVIYSAFRHDYAESNDKSAFVDGGRDYMRASPGSPIMWLSLEGPELKIFDDFEFVANCHKSQTQFKPGSVRDQFRTLSHELVVTQGMSISEFLVSVQYQRSMVTEHFKNVTLIPFSSLKETITPLEVKAWLTDNIMSEDDMVWVGGKIYLTDDSVMVSLKLKYG